jgi:hypothetical protein
MEKKKKYRVWLDQVNRQIVEVSAMNEQEAFEKAERKWRRENQARATYSEIVTDPLKP